MATPVRVQRLGRPRPIEGLLRPFQQFAQHAAASGIILLVCTVVALLWANSPWGESYRTLWGTKLTVGFGDFVLSKALLLWIIAVVTKPVRIPAK